MIIISIIFNCDDLSRAVAEQHLSSIIEYTEKQFTEKDNMKMIVIPVKDQPTEVKVYFENNNYNDLTKTLLKHYNINKTDVYVKREIKKLLRIIKINKLI
jgi:hypothetical protein